MECRCLQRLQQLRAVPLSQEPAPTLCDGASQEGELLASPTLSQEEELASPLSKEEPAAAQASPLSQEWLARLAMASAAPTSPPLSLPAPRRSQEDHLKRAREARKRKADERKQEAQAVQDHGDPVLNSRHTCKLSA